MRLGSHRVHQQINAAFLQHAAVRPIEAGQVVAEPEILGIFQIVRDSVAVQPLAFCPHFEKFGKNVVILLHRRPHAPLRLVQIEEEVERGRRGEFGGFRRQPQVVVDTVADRRIVEDAEEAGLIDSLRQRQAHSFASYRGEGECGYLSHSPAVSIVGVTLAVGDRARCGYIVPPGETAPIHGQAEADPQTAVFAGGIAHLAVDAEVVVPCGDDCFEFQVEFGDAAFENQASACSGDAALEVAEWNRVHQIFHKKAALTAEQRKLFAVGGKGDRPAPRIQGDAQSILRSHFYSRMRG